MTAARPEIPHVGVPGLRLVRSEFRKIFTTHAWWLIGLGTLFFTGLALLANTLRAAETLDEVERGFVPPKGMSPAEATAIAADPYWDVNQQLINQAASIFTSGQFFGLLLVLLLGVLVATNEFHHQTATATFLTTPKRSRVVAGKLVAGIGLAMLFFLVSQVINLVVGSAFFASRGQPTSLGEWSVHRPMLLNALAYLLWAIFGLGLGTLIRSQIGSVVTGLVVYLVGFLGGILVFNLIHEFLIKEDWVLTAAVGMPAVASVIMTSPTLVYDEAAPWWGGALSLVAWSLIFGLVGLVLTQRRDIS
jgi:ABC-type transport system involved in multi-copper enzyme maturation permease subunit